MALVELETLTWPEVRALGRAGTIGIVPLGALEQHGPHLPLATDTVTVGHLARLVADTLPGPVVVTPTVPVGVSSHHAAFPGTVTLDPQTLRDVVRAYVDGLTSAGITLVAIISHHGGNFASMRTLVEELGDGRADCTVRAYHDLDRYLEVERVAMLAAGTAVTAADLHAGAIETSIMLVVEPDAVRPEWSSLTGYEDDFGGTLERVLAEGVQAVNPDGILGSPSRASPGAGASVLDALVADLCAWLTTELGAGETPLVA